MGAKDLKTRKPLSSTVRLDLMEAFDKLSQETSIPKSKLMDKAIEMLINEYKK